MEKISNPYMDQEFREGIVFSKYKKNVIITLEAAKWSVDDRKKVSGYQTVPALADARNINHLTKEARNFFGSEEGYDMLSAAAILTDSILSAFIVNFFIKVNLKKASIPVKMFSNKEKAIKWLEQYK